MHVPILVFYSIHLILIIFMIIQKYPTYCPVKNPDTPLPASAALRAAVWKRNVSGK
jgi:hypothetical protein